MPDDTIHKERRRSYRHGRKQTRRWLGGPAARNGPAGAADLQPGFAHSAGTAGQYAVQHRGPHLRGAHPRHRQPGAGRPGGHLPHHRAHHRLFQPDRHGRRAPGLGGHGPRRLQDGGKDPGQLRHPADRPVGGAERGVHRLWRAGAAGLRRQRKHPALRHVLPAHLPAGHHLCPVHFGHDPLHHQPGLCGHQHGHHLHRRGQQHHPGPHLHLWAEHGGGGRSHRHHPQPGHQRRVGTGLFHRQAQCPADPQGKPRPRRQDPGPCAVPGRLAFPDDRHRVRHPAGLQHRRGHLRRRQRRGHHEHPVLGGPDRQPSSMG